MESDPSEPSYPSMIRLTSDLSSSFVAPGHAPPPVRGRRLTYTRAIPYEHRCASGGRHRDDADLGINISSLMDDMDGIC